jgi:hypothetical protein
VLITDTVAHTLQKAQMFGEATNDNQLMISLVTLWWELGGSDQNLVQTGWTIIADTMNLLDRQISNMRRQGYGAQH